MKFTISFKTNGMSLCAGEVDAMDVESAKTKASYLLERRNLKVLESASILDRNGTEVAILYMKDWNSKPRNIKWLTVHNLSKKV